MSCFSEGSRKMEHKGNSWHETCFTCQRCQQPIGTKSFIPKDNHNFCVPCYEKQFAMQCVHCKKVLLIPYCVNLSNQPLHIHSTFKCINAPFPFFHQPITTGGVTYRDQPWHKDCFLCTSCKLQLTGQRFTSRDDFAYCLNCFCNLYAKKCASCTTPISGNHISSLAEHIFSIFIYFNLTRVFLSSGLGGSKYISFEERQWHNDCFNCKKCSVSLVGRGFLTERDDILCPECGKDI